MLFSNKDLKRLIIPLIIEQILAVLVGTVDTMMISTAGEAAISGVSLVNMINVVIITLLASLATGGAVVSSQLLGAGQGEDACRSSNQLMLVAASASLLVTALFMIGRQGVLRLLFGSIEEDVMRSALIYISITALSFPFLAVYNSSAALFRSMGKSRVTMYVSMMMNVINVTGNYILVYRLHLGVAGVAIPTLVSRAVAGVVMFCLLHDKRHVIHLTRGGYKPDARMIRRILHIAIPNGLENSLFQLGRLLVVSIISGFGTVQIAANAVANNLMNMGIILASALNLAVIPVVGRCIGARDFGQARYFTRKLLTLTYLLNGAENLLMIVLMPKLLGLYDLSEEAARLAGTLELIHASFGILMWPSAFSLPCSLRAAGDVRFTMTVSIFSMAAFRIVASYILGAKMGMGAIGVWIGMVIDWVFRTALFVWRWRSGIWEKFAPAKAS